MEYPIIEIRQAGKFRHEDTQNQDKRIVINI